MYQAPTTAPYPNRVNPATTTRAPVHPPTQPKLKLKCLVLGASSAGKTSILRRYFYGNFEGNRVPTLGSDWYTKRLLYAITSSDSSPSQKDEEVSISLQLWDTPGRERLDAKRSGGQPHQQSSLQASFLEQADAYMLVYDVTSSTSFKQLLKWYADLVQLFETKNPHMQPVKLPVLVVGTKMDLLQSGQQTNNQQQDGSQQRRNVLGLHGRHWKGSSYHYEYQVSTSEQPQPNETPLLARPHANRMEIASYYLADRENWNNDWGYLDGLLSSEDGSHPDRDMVVLWCSRNDLKHMEASAATGQGVDEAMKELVRLAMDKRHPAHSSSAAAPFVGSTEQNLTTALKHNKMLDLHERYGPKDDHCCFCWRGLRRR